jgi:hypothetical protein
MSECVTQEGERKSEYDDSSTWTFISLQLLKVMLLLDGTELLMDTRISKF